MKVPACIDVGNVFCKQCSSHANTPTPPASATADAELRQLLLRKPNPIAYDGFEPSGRMHIAQVNSLSQCHWSACDMIDRFQYDCKWHVEAPGVQAPRSCTWQQLLWAASLQCSFGLHGYPTLAAGLLLGQGGFWGQHGAAACAKGFDVACCLGPMQCTVYSATMHGTVTACP